MPLDTDSDVWKNAGTPSSLEADILQFLTSNPDSAYRMREIADDVLGANFEAFDENIRLEYMEDRGEITAEELSEQQEDVPILVHRLDELELEVRTLALVEKGLVERRIVDDSENDSPYEEGKTVYYTSSLE